MTQLYEIKHRYTGAVLFSLECGSLKLCVEAAVTARANLRGADLGGANLSGANLSGADLGGAYLIDGGQDARGFRFWAWRNNDGAVIYRGGCREWLTIEAARSHYDSAYGNDGDATECLARIELMHVIAIKRWPAQAVAA